MSAVTGLAFLLLLAGLLGGLDERVPGGVLSLAGVLGYWRSTGGTEPATPTLFLLVVVCLVAIAGQVLGMVLVRRYGSGSSAVATLATAVGLGAFLFLGTLGFVAGVIATIFVVTYLRRRDIKESLLRTLVTVCGSFATRTVQFLLSSLVLVIMGFVVFV